MTWLWRSLAAAYRRARVAYRLHRREQQFAAAVASRMQRETALRAQGFDDPTSEQRREQLARNMALKDWPQ